MSAIVPAVGKVRQLDRQAEPDNQVSPDDAGDPARASRLFMRILRDLEALKRQWWPPTVDHRDRVVDGTGTTLYRFPHGFGGRVNWWPLDWTGAAGPQLARDASSDDSTLVLVSFVAGTVSIRVEAAG